MYWLRVQGIIHPFHIDVKYFDFYGWKSQVNICNGNVSIWIKYLRAVSKSIYNQYKEYTL